MYERLVMLTEIYGSEICKLSVGEKKRRGYEIYEAYGEVTE